MRGADVGLEGGPTRGGEHHLGNLDKQEPMALNTDEEKVVQVERERVADQSRRCKTQRFGCRPNSLSPQVRNQHTLMGLSTLGIHTA